MRCKVCGRPVALDEHGPYHDGGTPYLMRCPQCWRVWDGWPWESECPRCSGKPKVEHRAEPEELSVRPGDIVRLWGGEVVTILRETLFGWDVCDGAHKLVIMHPQPSLSDLPQGVLVTRTITEHDIMEVAHDLA